MTCGQILELQSSVGEWQHHSNQCQRLAGVVTGMLRLLVAAAAVQPANKGAQREALAFAKVHASALVTLLQAAGTATPRWKPEPVAFCEDPDFGFPDIGAF